MASDQQEGTFAMDSILNFRDIGTFTNNHTTQPLLKPNRLYRSARPDAATPRDRHTLTTTLRIRTIIDLRTPTEHLEARKLLTSHPTPTTPGLAPPDPQRPFRIPGTTYVDVNLNGDAYTNALLQHLTWPQTLRLYALYALGYRKDAIAILATNVMAPRGLSGLAVDTLTHSGAHIAAIFSLLSETPTFPVLIHCTQGKDRTGLIVLLVLLLCGVPDEVIEADYMASQAGLARERTEKVTEVRGIGLPEGFADCEVGWVGKVRRWIEERWGGVEAYLESIGVGPDARERVRANLLVST